MSDDLISRQAAITALEIEKTYSAAFCDGYAKTDIFEKYNMGLTDGIKAIKRLQSAQQWIPVTERLPEEHEMVIVTICGSDLIVSMEGETLEDALERNRKIKTVTVGFIGSDGWYGADWFPMMVRPSAWMPLPEPFRGGEADGT